MVCRGYPGAAPLDIPVMQENGEEQEQELIQELRETPDQEELQEEELPLDQQEQPAQQDPNTPHQYLTTDRVIDVILMT